MTSDATSPEHFPSEYKADSFDVVIVRQPVILNQPNVFVPILTHTAPHFAKEHHLCMLR